MSKTEFIYECNLVMVSYEDIETIVTEIEKLMAKCNITYKYRGEEIVNNDTVKRARTDFAAQLFNDWNKPADMKGILNTHLNFIHATWKGDVIR